MRRIRSDNDAANSGQQMPLKSNNLLTSRLIWASFAVSFVLHLAALYWFGELRHKEIEAEEFRVRLAYYQEILKPRRLATTPLTTPEAASASMEYLPAGGEPAESGDAIEIGLPEPIALAPVDPSLSPTRVDQGEKSATPILARERMVSPRDMGLADSLSREPMELLRWQDMARANRQHAGVIPNLASPRDIEGYINFSRIRVHGAGSDSAGSLDALARYVRDHTGIFARVEDELYRYFLSEQLLKDPIHFLVEGHGLRNYDPSQMTWFSAEELALLKGYIDSGGFLFIEGSAEPPQRFLHEMIEHLQAIIGADGGIFELPADHPLYFSFFSFDMGFPGEDKHRVQDWGQNSWYYPESRFRRLGTDTTEGPAEPLGLYGINYRGDLVGVISDLGMADRWVDRVAAQDQAPPANANLAAEPPPIVDHEGALQSGTNIVVYALTRPGGITPSYAKPVWAAQRPEWLPEDKTRGDYVDVDGSTAYKAEYEADELFAELDSYFALLHSPLGQETAAGEMTVRIDGAYSLQLLRGGVHGVMLHNLPPGHHWLELSYGGKSMQVEFDLAGGQVTTATFSLNRIAFFTQLRLRRMEEVVELRVWRESFGDLYLEEVFLDSDSEVLEGAGELPADSP